MWYHRQLFHGRQKFDRGKPDVVVHASVLRKSGRKILSWVWGKSWLCVSEKQTNNKTNLKQKQNKPKIVWKVKIKKVDTPNRVNTILLVPSFHKEWKCREEDMWNALPHAYMDRRGFQKAQWPRRYWMLLSE